MISEQAYNKLTDKYMLQLLEFFQPDPKDKDTLNKLGAIVCDCVLEAMKSVPRPFLYEIGILEKVTGTIDRDTMKLAFPDETSGYFWDMRAGFTTEEEAQRYREQLKQTDSRPNGLFINGIPAEY